MATDGDGTGDGTGNGDGTGKGDAAPSTGPGQGPRLSQAGRTRVDDRRARQAEALRANLRRRKDQRRARDEDAGPEPALTPEKGSGDRDE